MHPPSCLHGTGRGGRIKGLHRRTCVHTHTHTHTSHSSAPSAAPAQLAAPSTTGIPRGSVAISAYPNSIALNFHQMPPTRLKSRHQGMHHSLLAGETETQVGAVAGLRSWSQQHWGELGKFLLLRSMWGSLPHPIGPRGHAGISALAQVQTCPCVPSSGM